MIMILDVDVTAEGGIIKLIARKGNPLNPLNLLNPGRGAAPFPLLFPFRFCKMKKGIIFSGYPAPNGAFLLPAFPQKAHMRDKAG